MCPFKESSCGQKREYFFKNVNSSQNIEVNLGPGDVCVYNIRAECGVPSYGPVGLDT